MHMTVTLRGWWKTLVFAGLCTVAIGCRTVPLPPMPAPPDVPRELSNVTLPPYRIGPPDILQIEAVILTLNDQGKPIKTEQPKSLWPQPVSGQFLVKPDGTVELGVYGSTQLAGLTIAEAREAIQGFLAYVTELKPALFAVAVDVVQFNSKPYYVITDGAGFGEGVFRFPITGGENVLDAIANIQGLPQVASKRHVWVARRGPGGYECPDQILPVDWCAIAQCGDIRTNYQILPGDRIYIMSQPLIRTNIWIQKVLGPIQQALGITLLGSETVRSVRGN